MLLKISLLLGIFPFSGICADGVSRTALHGTATFQTSAVSDSCKLGVWMDAFAQKNNLDFVFESGLIDKETDIFCPADSVSVIESLQQVFGKRNIAFKLVGNHVLLTPFAGGSEKNASGDTTITRLLQDVYVHGHYAGRSNPVQSVGRFILDPALLNALPSPGSEKDVIKILQLIPGVQNTREGLSELQVRGGGAGENLFLYENVSLYNPSHLFGFFSAFDADLIRSMDFYKAAFPARYGGRLSSVVDMSIKDGSEDEAKRKISIGLLSSKFIFEQSFNQGKTSFMLYGRTTYLDLIAMPLYRLFSRTKTERGESSSFYNYHFYDLNGKITHRFSDRHHVSLFAYHGNDFFRYKESDKEKLTVDGIPQKSEQTISNTNLWGNTVSGISYRFMPRPDLMFKALAAYNYTHNSVTEKQEYRYEGESSTGNTHTGEMKMRSSVSDWLWKGEVQWTPGNRHRVSGGIDLTHHTYIPAIHKGKMSSNEQVQLLQYTETRKTLEGGVYLEDIWRIARPLELSLGGRFSWLKSGKALFTHFEPRIGINWQVFKNLSLQGGYTEMSQYAHLVQKTSLLLPANQWLPAVKGIKPSMSRQYSGGIFYHITSDYLFSLEGYYKRAYHVTEYKDNAVFNTSDWRNNLTQGDGEAYGVEVQFRKTLGKTQGWIGYTYSRSERWFENKKVNRGKRYQSDYHAPHMVNIVLIHRFSDRFDISASWNYRGGVRTTLATEYYDFNTIVPGNFDGYLGFVGSQNPIAYAETRNNYKLPANHRLDLGANFHKKRKRGTSTWSIDIYNAYCRMNPIGARVYYEKIDGKDRAFISYTWLLPLIPSFTYTFTF
ncbi:MAG: TonB-dependent receptor plug domain-containing protein [Bacteroidales bacterium]